MLWGIHLLCSRCYIKRGIFNRDWLLTVDRSAQMQMWAARIGSCQDVMTATCVMLVSVLSALLQVYMGAMRVKTGVRDGRGLGDCQGPHLPLQMGRPKQNKNQTSYLLRFSISHQLIPHWQADIPELGKHRISCMTWDVLLDFGGVLVLLSIKWKSCSTDRAIVMISDILLCCSIHRNIIVNIMNNPHLSPMRQAQLFCFLQILFPNFILMLFRCLRLKVCSEDQDY